MVVNVLNQHCHSRVQSILINFVCILSINGGRKKTIIEQPLKKNTFSKKPFVFKFFTVLLQKVYFLQIHKNYDVGEVNKLVQTFVTKSCHAVEKPIFKNTFPTIPQNKNIAKIPTTPAPIILNHLV